MAGADINEQLKLMEDFTVQKPDAIAVCSYDASAIVPGIETAMAAGIPVFCLDNNCTGTEIVSFIGTDNVLGGYLMGKYINEVMGGEGEMAVIEGPAGNFNSNIRRQGMNQAFEEIGSKVEVVASISANWKRDQGLTVANDIITSTPDLKLIFCLNDEMAFGAMQAIEASGRDIMLVAYNGVPEAFMNIYNGHMLATVAQYPETFATTYIDCAIALVRDGVQPEATYAIPAAVVDYEQQGPHERRRDHSLQQTQNLLSGIRKQGCRHAKYHKNGTPDQSGSGPGYDPQIYPGQRSQARRQDPLGAGPVGAVRRGTAGHPRSGPGAEHDERHRDPSAGRDVRHAA